MYHATPLSWTRSQQGPFAPPELPGLNATTTPSDSCSSPIAVMDSLDQSRRVPKNPSPPEQVSQVPDRSVDARCPLPPRRARPLQVLVASRPVSGFTQSGRLAAPTCVTRPKRVHAFALRLTSLSSRAPHPGSPRRTPSRLHGERAIPMISSFQLTRSAKLSLAHQMTQMNADEDEEEWNLLKISREFKNLNL